MKKVLIISLMLQFVSAMAIAGELDGKQFCRTIKSEGMFGQPAGERQHCVSFDSDRMSDNSNTFFGNPPTTTKYVLVANKVLTIENGELSSSYKLGADGSSLIYGDNVVLSLSK